MNVQERRIWDTSTQDIQYDVSITKQGQFSGLQSVQRRIRESPKQVRLITVSEDPSPEDGQRGTDDVFSDLISEKSMVKIPQ